MRLPWLTQLYLVMDSERTVFSVGNQIVFDEPTCVAVYPDSDAVVAVGREAVALQHSGQNILRVEWPISKGRVANTEATLRFLRAILQRAEVKLGFAGKFLGYSGRYAHPTGASPAELHIYGQVLAQAGLSGLRPTAASQAVSQVSGQSKRTDYCTCTFHSDWTELTIFGGNLPLFTAEIEWGTASFPKMIQDAVTRQLGSGISRQTAELVLQQLIDCSIISTPELGKQRKETKMSLKAKELATTTSKPIVVSQSLFSDSLETVLSPLVEGIRSGFETLDDDVFSAVSSTGVLLLGEGEDITGLSNYLAHALDLEVSWLSDPRASIHTGLRLLDQPDQSQ